MKKDPKQNYINQQTEIKTTAGIKISKVLAPSYEKYLQAVEPRTFC